MICLGDTWETKILIRWLTACAWHGGIVGWLMDTIFSSFFCFIPNLLARNWACGNFLCSLFCFYHPPASFSVSRKEMRALRCSFFFLFFSFHILRLCADLPVMTDLCIAEYAPALASITEIFVGQKHLAACHLQHSDTNHKESMDRIEAFRALFRGSSAD